MREPKSYVYQILEFQHITRDKIALKRMYPIFFFRIIINKKKRLFRLYTPIRGRKIAV